MSQALPGEHYCVKHQGNNAHYAEHNCTVCKLLASRTKESKERRLLRELRLDLTSVANSPRAEIMIAKIDALLAAKPEELNRRMTMRMTEQQKALVGEENKS